MSDTATLDKANQNGSHTPSDGKQKGKKRPATRLVSALSGNLAEAKLEYKIAETPTDWAKLKVNTTFSNSKSGTPLCVKISASAYCVVFGNSRESGIAGGEVYRVFQ